MFTITFKGKPNPKDENLVKLEMVFFRTGYNRTPKMIAITGLYEDWDQKNQSFKTNIKKDLERNKSNQSKNNALLELKTKYLNAAEELESQANEWSPIQWSHCFEEDNGTNKKEKVKVLSVSQCIDIIIEELKNRKRFKNGKLISSESTAGNYHQLRLMLQYFTKEFYNKSFSSYFFKDIDEKFVKDFVLYLQQRGIKNGNSAALPERLKKFYGVFYYSHKMGQPHTENRIFDFVKPLFKRKENPPQTIPHDWILKIEEMDKSEFTEKEQLYIDVFLFSFYAGGMANVDVCNMTWDWIDNDIISYERIKYPKEAEMLFNAKAKAIVKKYMHQCYDNYVLPIFNHKHKSETQQRTRMKHFRSNVNKTLRKVSEKLDIEEFTWYAARGTFITKMVDEGYHPVAVAKFAGNSPSTIYKHYWDQTKKEDILNHMNQVL